MRRLCRVKSDLALINVSPDRIDERWVDSERILLQFEPALLV
jgi:hypothetical protein